MAVPFGVRAFVVDSSMELVADGYTAELERADAFLSAADTDVVTLEAGLIDRATGTPHTVRHLEGNIDEYELTLKGDSLQARVRGRDLLFELVERPFRKLYLRQQPAQDPGIPYAVGTFRASEVARDVVVAAGLALSWECRDYTLLQDFDASGRSVDVLRRLVEPWSLVPMFRVDLFVQGSTVFLRARKGSGLVADYTFPAKDARITQLTVRRNRTPRYGTVVLEGRMVPKGAGGGGTVIVQPSEIEEVKSSETRDASGTVTGRTVRTEVYRMPDRILLRSVARKFGRQGGAMVLTDEETRHLEYEPSRYGFLGAQNQPKQLEERMQLSGVHPQDKTKTFRELRKELVSFSYDGDGFLDMTLTKKFEAKQSKNPETGEIEFGELIEKERVVRTLAEIEQLKVEEVTTLYKFTKEATLYVERIDTQISAGIRPGGTRPPRAIVVGGGNTTPMEPLRLEKIVETDPLDPTQPHPKGVEVRYANANLEQADLDFLMDQFTQASGLWEYELLIDYVSMPWLRKGSVLRITNLFAADGATPIALQPALIIGQTLQFDESQESPEMVSRLTAVFWAP